MITVRMPGAELIALTLLAIVCLLVIGLRIIGGRRSRRKRPTNDLGMMAPPARHNVRVSLSGGTKRVVVDGVEVHNPAVIGSIATEGGRRG